MAKDPKYSHRSNGNCQCQNCRTGGKENIRYDNESTGNASTQELLDEGVSSREPFDRQAEDYEIYPMG